jgi:hypothetical protein
MSTVISIAELEQGDRLYVPQITDPDKPEGVFLPVDTVRVNADGTRTITVNALGQQVDLPPIDDAASVTIA